MPHNWTGSRRHPTTGGRPTPSPTNPCSGIVTFRNAEALREVARRVPADRLLVETERETRDAGGNPTWRLVPHRQGPNLPAIRSRGGAEYLATLDVSSIRALECRRCCAWAPQESGTAQSGPPGGGEVARYGKGASLCRSRYATDRKRDTATREREGTPEVKSQAFVWHARSWR